MNNDNDINSRIERIEEKLNTISALLPQLIDAYEEGQAAIRRLDEMRARNRLRMQNVRAQANLCTHTEKEEAEKRDISPTPPIERKGEEEKEDHYPTRARATVPTIEQAKSYAEVCIKDSTPEKVEEWFAMCRGDDWCDADGQPIRNWHRNLNRFVMNYALFAKLRDPERIYDCRRKDEPKADPAAAAREKRAREIADELRRKGLL